MNEIWKFLFVVENEWSLKQVEYQNSKYLLLCSAEKTVMHVWNDKALKGTRVLRLV